MSKTRIHVPEKQVIEFRTEIQERLRRRVQEAIHLVLEEELTEALGCPRYERDGERRGYRNGRERRTITTTVGARELKVPRGRIFEEGGSREFRSRLLPRYARRTREVDDAILSCYLAGANSRKIRKAQVRCWAPLSVQEHDLAGRGAAQGTLSAVARSLEEAGQLLLTLFEFPKPLWLPSDHQHAGGPEPRVPPSDQDSGGLHHRVGGPSPCCGACWPSVICG